MGLLPFCSDEGRMASSGWRHPGAESNGQNKLPEDVGRSPWPLVEDNDDWNCRTACAAINCSGASLKGIRKRGTGTLFVTLIHSQFDTIQNYCFYLKF